LEVFVPRILVLENEFANLWYYPETRIIHHQFLKPIGGEHFKEVLNTGLEILKTKKAHKWLSDDRANSRLAPEDTNWSDHVWLPQMVAAGWEYWALVLPLKRLGKINMEKQTETVADTGVVVQYFSDPKTALQWLELQ
jgi:hypothetical protein